MSNIAGIDLGTTYSGISILDQSGKPQIIKNDDGEYITPSVVGFPSAEKNKIWVGKFAKQLLISEPSRVVTRVKRDMGSDSKKYSIGDKEYSPEEISAQILRKIIQDAEKTEGKISSVVITVPAWFGENERQSTKEAGEEAGFTVDHIINEPTAAALYYATKNPLAGKILVYDLGGGTFDATIAEIKDNDVSCLASQGDGELGGVDFDEVILRILKKEYKNKYNKELVREDNTIGNENYYLEIAEEIKIILSKKETYKEIIRGMDGPVNIEISRKDFENSISTYLAKIDLLIDAVLNEKSLKDSDISNVLLVGGSTRIPIISEKIKNRFGKDPLSSVNVDEAVALGASIYSGKKADPNLLSTAQKKEIENIKMQDVTNINFGTTVQKFNKEKNEYVARNVTIIKKNTPLPCSNTETHYTMADGQLGVMCDVTESKVEEADPQFVEKIWEDKIGNLPPDRPAGQPIESTFSYDTNGSMHCLFKDTQSGEKVEVTLHPGSNEKIEKSKINLSNFIVE